MIARLRRWLADWQCRLSGHDTTIVADGRRLYVRCETCKRDSVGIAIDGEPVRKFAGHVTPTIRTETRTVTRKLRRQKRTNVLPMRERARA